jgi:methionine sulfoxide reductase heme-binding subunit
VLADLHPQTWWYLARAAGFVAWGASLSSIMLGLALATRALGNKPRPAWLLDLHRFTGGLTVAFLGVHLGALVADSYVHFGTADLLVPLASGWKTGAVAWGVVAMWLLVAVELSSLLMRRLPRRAWRTIHLTSYLAAVLSTIHAFTAGTDAKNPLITWVAVGAVSSAAFFLVFRLLLPKRRARVNRRADQPATVEPIAAPPAPARQ